MKFISEMRIGFILTLIMVFGLSDSLIGQDTTTKQNKFVLIPEITEKIKLEENGIEVEKVEFQYKNEYKYEGGIVFGSQIRLFMDGIEGMSSFEGMTYLMKRTRIISKASKDTLINEDWQFADQGRGYKLSDGEDLTYWLPINVGSPMYSGDYLWELEIADLCSKKTAKVSVDVRIIPNSNIQIVTKGKVAVREAYFFMTREQDIIPTNKIPASVLEFRFDKIEGFKVIQNKYNIGLALEVFDKDQKSILKIDDAAPNEKGIKKPVRGALNVGGTFRFTEEFKGKKLFLVAQIWDKNGSGVSVIGKTLITVI